MPNKVKDLLGQRFGLLTVVERAPNIGGRAAWRCKCDCGGEKIARSSNLQKGNTQSCGCKNKKQLMELHNQNIIDITGQRFGKLVAIEKVGSDASNNSTWLCKCDCGSVKIISSAPLRRGAVKSCGCIKSINEELIGKMLSENNIPFIKEHIIKDPNSGEQYRFDFFVNNQYYIEYDGQQHFMGGSGWITEDKVKYTHYKDINKNKYCFENNIPIIRIPYDVEYTFNDLLLETTNFLLTPNNENIYYERLDKNIETQYNDYIKEKGNF